MTTKTRAPLASEMSSADIDALATQDTLISYKTAIKNGFVSGLILVFVQVLLSFIIFIISRNTYIFEILYNFLAFEVAFLFIASGLAIWFESSPSWNKLKATIVNRPYVQKTISEAYRIGTVRFISAITLLLFIDIASSIISLFI